MKKKILISLCSILLLFSSCHNLTYKPKVGLLLDSYLQERWKKDKEYFIQNVNELGGTVISASSQGNFSLQYAQAMEMFRQNVDVIVLVAVDQELASRIVDMAHRKGIKVIAYDRLIKNCDLDFYISFDNINIGAQQAKQMLSIKPKGKYILINGPGWDNNSSLLKHGQYTILNQYIKVGLVSIVYKEYAEDWTEGAGYWQILNCLQTYGKDFDAVIAGNDNLARGIIKGLKENLITDVPVAGQDADMASCKAILTGDQAMTVYKPIRKIAKTAAQIAMLMARNKIIDADSIIYFDNNKVSVPTILLKTIPLDKNNLESVITSDGYITQQQLFN